jgi:hypothetical protein
MWFLYSPIRYELIPARENVTILTNIDTYSAKSLPKEIEMKTLMMTWSFFTHSCKTLDETTKLRFL